MKAKVTAEITGILLTPIKHTAIIDFGENSNVFGRAYDARQYFYKLFNVNYEQVSLIKCDFIKDE